MVKMTDLNDFKKMLYVDISYIMPLALQQKKETYFSYKIPCFNIIQALKIIRDFYELDVNKIYKISVYELVKQDGNTRYIFRKKYSVDSDELKNILLTLKKFHK